MHARTGGLRIRVPAIDGSPHRVPLLACKGLDGPSLAGEAKFDPGIPITENHAGGGCFSERLCLHSKRRKISAVRVVRTPGAPGMATERNERGIPERRSRVARPRGLFSEATCMTMPSRKKDTRPRNPCNGA